MNPARLTRSLWASHSAMGAAQRRAAMRTDRESAADCRIDPPGVPKALRRVGMKGVRPTRKHRHPIDRTHPEHHDRPAANRKLADYYGGSLVARGLSVTMIADVSGSVVQAGVDVIQAGRLLCRSASNAVMNREKERNLQSIQGLARFCRTIQRRVMRAGNQSSAWCADQHNHC